VADAVFMRWSAAGRLIRVVGFVSKELREPRTDIFGAAMLGTVPDLGQIVGPALSWSFYMA
jgi:hypothetical protein